MPHHHNVPRVCQQCGTAFVAEGHQVNIGKARFCSKRCANRANARPPQPLAVRFWRYVDTSGDCWLWLGAKDAKGYGRFTITDAAGSPKPILAHRFAWSLAHGMPASAVALRHDCDNPSCVRVEHLRTGTLADNNRDMRERGRQARGEQCRRSDLTATDIRDMRATYAAGGTSQRALAQQYRVSQSVISEIIRRVSWGHID